MIMHIRSLVHDAAGPAIVAQKNYTVNSLSVWTPLSEETIR